MSPELAFGIALAVLFIGMFSGLPVALSMGLMGIIAVGFLMPRPMFAQIGPELWNGSHKWLLVCVPLFLLMGYFMSNSRLSSYIFDFGSAWLRGLPGGMINGCLAGAGIFGAATGSSVADAATMAAVAYPELKRRGYDISMATGALAAGGTVGILIPPSLTMILYASFNGESVGRLFIGGIVPGVIMISLFIVATVIQVLRNPALAPKEPPLSFKAKMIATVKFLPVGVIIASVLVMIYGGVTTPTEAAGVGAFLVLMAAIAYRRFSFKFLWESLREAVTVTATIQIIVISAMIILYFLNWYDITELLTSMITGLPFSPIAIMVCIYLILVVLGCVVEALTLIILLSPILYPIITALGFSGLWFGVIFVMLIQIALVTPPVGLNVFVINAVCEGSNLQGVFKGSTPYLIIMVFTVALCTAFPQIITWLPSTMMK